MSERDPFTPLAIDDPRRPIKVLGTTDAEVPSPSKRFLDHRVDTVRFPNGNEGYHHRIIVPEGVMLAHLNDKDEVALVQNYRHPLGRDSVELPSGGAEPAEGERLLNASPEEREHILNEIARREFEEEIGWRLEQDEIQRLLPGPLQGSVGFANQTYHTFVGKGGRQTQQSLDDGESGLLTFKRYSIEDAGGMLGHEIVDPATSVAIYGLAMALGKNIGKLKL